MSWKPYQNANTKPSLNKYYKRYIIKNKHKNKLKQCNKRQRNKKLIKRSLRRNKRIDLDMNLYIVKNILLS